MKNFFDLYEIPIAVNVDKNHILQRYYALSRLYHPDHKSAHSSEAEMRDLLEQSANVNQAKNIFLSRDKTIDYILSLKASELGQSQALPADFLMEMMETNEQVEECVTTQDAMAKETLKRQINEMLQALDEEFLPYIEGYSQSVQDDKTYLSKLLEYRNKKKYMTRLLASLS